MSGAKKLTLSIGIPAYNEEANIQKLLNLLLQQNSRHYDLKEIIVNSDGSDDSTVEQANAIGSPLIKVWDNTDRIGKTKRINQIMNEATGQIVAFIDADVIPASKYTFDELVKPFLKSEKIVYVSGSLIPVTPKNFIEKSISISRSVWDKIRRELNKGYNVYACHGAIYALRDSFAKEANFPDSIWADIGFHYFLAKQKKLKFAPAPKASIYFKLPSTAKEYITQISRYQREDLSNINHFGPGIIKEYYIPKSMLTEYKLAVFLKWPLHMLAIFALNYYAKHLKKFNSNAQAQWTMIRSTKEKIINV